MTYSILEEWIVFDRRTITLPERDVLTGNAFTRRLIYPPSDGHFSV